MTKANTLQAQVAAVAKAVPREPLMDALALAVRKTAAPRPMPERPLRTATHTEAEAKAVAAPKRMRRVGFRKYKVLRASAYMLHKRGSWARFMVETITDHADTRAATQAHKASERYPKKTLDFNWCVKQGYIAYE